MEASPWSQMTGLLVRKTLQYERISLGDKNKGPGRKTIMARFALGDERDYENDNESDETPNQKESEIKIEQRSTLAEKGKETSRKTIRIVDVDKTEKPDTDITVRQTDERSPTRNLRPLHPKSDIPWADEVVDRWLLKLEEREKHLQQEKNIDITSHYKQRHGQTQTSKVDRKEVLSLPTSSEVYEMWRQKTTEREKNNMARKQQGMSKISSEVVKTWEQKVLDFEKQLEELEREYPSPHKRKDSIDKTGNADSPYLTSDEAVKLWKQKVIIQQMEKAQKEFDYHRRHYTKRRMQDAASKFNLFVVHDPEEDASKSKEPHEITAQETKSAKTEVTETKIQTEHLSQTELLPEHVSEINLQQIKQISESRLQQETAEPESESRRESTVPEDASIITILVVKKELYRQELKKRQEMTNRFYGITETKAPDDEEKQESHETEDVKEEPSPEKHDDPAPQMDKKRPEQSGAPINQTQATPAESAQPPKTDAKNIGKSPGARRSGASITQPGATSAKSAQPPKPVGEKFQASPGARRRSDPTKTTKKDAYVGIKYASTTTSKRRPDAPAKRPNPIRQDEPVGAKYGYKNNFKSKTSPDILATEPVRTTYRATSTSRRTPDPHCNQVSSVRGQSPIGVKFGTPTSKRTLDYAGYQTHSLKVNAAIEAKYGSGATCKRKPGPEAAPKTALTSKSDKIISDAQAKSRIKAVGAQYKPQQGPSRSQQGYAKSGLATTKLSHDQPIGFPTDSEKTVVGTITPFRNLKDENKTVPEEEMPKKDIPTEGVPEGEVLKEIISKVAEEKFIAVENPEAAEEEVVLNSTEKGDGERYSIRKVQIRPRKTLGLPVDGNYLTHLPVLPDKPGPYVPMPYIFRVATDSKPVRVKNILARTPPFHLLLDHTIAVVWLLFAKEEYECPLGIAQLQWALAFLKTIHMSKGNRPKDVETCIEAIQDILLEEYSKLAKELPLIQKLDNSVPYSEGAFGAAPTVPIPMPFSLNYAEMAEKFKSVEGDVDKTKSITSIEASERLECIKQVAGVKSIEDLDEPSKLKAMRVMKMWQNEQLERIRAEMSRLRDIEDKMKDIDENYRGFLDEHDVAGLDE